MKRLTTSPTNEEPKKEPIKVTSEKKIVGVNDGLLTSLVFCSKSKTGFKVESEEMFSGFCLPSHFSIIGGENKYANDRYASKKINMALSKYIKTSSSIFDGLTHSEKIKIATYAYDLAAPGALCVIVWDFKTKEGGDKLDRYFSDSKIDNDNPEKLKRDICGEYIYGSLFYEWTSEQLKRFDWLWKV